MTQITLLVPMLMLDLSTGTKYIEEFNSVDYINHFLTFDAVVKHNGSEHYVTTEFKGKTFNIALSNPTGVTLSGYASPKLEGLNLEGVKVSVVVQTPDEPICRLTLNSSFCNSFEPVTLDSNDTIETFLTFSKDLTFFKVA